MLEILRKSVGSWVAKILFAILILSFGVWGVADFVLTGPAAPPAITVGDIEIDARDVNEQFNRDVARLRGMFAGGAGLTAEDARRMGMMDQTINRLLTAAVVDMAARTYGVSTPDDIVRDAIVVRPEFKGPGGQFDAELFRQLLGGAGLSEAGFTAMERDRLTRRQVIEPVIDAGATPAPVAELLYRYRNERRVAESVTIVPAAMPDPGVPDAAALEAYHKEHADVFTAPEFRRVTALVLDQAAVAGLIPVTDDELRQAYDQRHDSFVQPERRTVEHVVYPTRDQAEAVSTRVKAGASLVDAVRAAAEAAGAAAPPVVSLGAIARGGAAGELGTAPFDLPLEQVGGPVQSPFGWHLVRVTAIEPGSTRTLEDARTELTQAVIAEKSADEIYALSGKVEDALNSGSSIEAVAKSFSLPVRVLEPFDRHGVGTDGKAVTGVPLMKTFLPTVFASQVNQPPSLVESDDGFFAVRVDEVIASRLRPVAEVSDRLVKAWTEDRRQEAARARAEDGRGRLAAGEDLAKVAESVQGTAATSAPVTRSGEGGSLPMPQVAQLFRLRLGEAALVSANDGVTVLRLKEILAADPAADGVGVIKVRADLDDQYASDLQAQFTQALARSFEATVNRKALGD